MIRWTTTPWLDSVLIVGPAARLGPGESRMFVRHWSSASEPRRPGSAFGATSCERLTFSAACLTPGPGHRRAVPLADPSWMPLPGTLRHVEARLRQCSPDWAESDKRMHSKTSLGAAPACTSLILPEWPSVRSNAALFHGKVTQSRDASRMFQVSQPFTLKPSFDPAISSCDA